MSYATLQRKIEALPEDYLDEIADYIEYIIFRHNNAKQAEPSDLSKYFGTVKFKKDALELQGSMRDEWN